MLQQPLVLTEHILNTLLATNIIFIPTDSILEHISYFFYVLRIYGTGCHPHSPQPPSRRAEPWHHEGPLSELTRRCSQQLHHQRSRLPQGQLQGEPLQKSYLYLIHSPTKTRKPLRDVPTPSDSFLVAV